MRAYYYFRVESSQPAKSANKKHFLSFSLCLVDGLPLSLFLGKFPAVSPPSSSYIHLNNTAVQTPKELFSYGF